jgi:hypothetical protein
MPVQTCKWEMKTAAMSQGASIAAKWFGMSESDIEAACERFTKGKNKGALRGWIVYRKCTEGGWSFPLHSVVRPGMIFARFCKSYDESCEAVNLPTDRFIPSATRVDSAYGYSPEQARAQIAQAASNMADQSQSPGLTAADLIVGIWLSAMASGGTVEPADSHRLFN